MKKILLLLLIATLSSCAKSGFDPEWTTESAPEKFKAKFETTKGNFEIEVERKWSPKAADRLYQLIKHKYYDNAVFYRVVKNYVAQFGNSDTTVMNKWRSVKIPDEPVKLSNTRGTLSFARFGPASRDLEIFINLTDNSQLDTTVVEGVKGYPAIGRVTSGMESVDKLYSGYGERTMTAFEGLYSGRSQFLATFPNLDVITKAYLLE